MSNIKINIEDSIVIKEVLSSVGKFYSIDGAPMKTNLHGHDALFDITNTKINQLITGELPASCNQLINEVTDRFSDFIVMPEIERQFPNYALNIELAKIELKELTIIYNLKLRISLLTHFFTIFHEETIIHKNSSSFHHHFVPVITNVLSSNSIVTDKENRHFESLKKIVNSIFIGYRYISHQLLFNEKISNGTPYGFEPNSSAEYPLYNFLFDNDYNVSFLPYIAP